MLDEPAGRVHSGGATAAPLFARIAAGQLVRHGILTHPELPLPRIASVQPDADAPPREPEPGPEANPNRPSEPAAEEPEHAVLIAILQDRLLLPDFRGLSNDEVRQATRGIRLEVEMKGRGRAVSQDPAPGTILAGTTRRVSVQFMPRGEEL